jgi:SulP family sulfate permease
LTIVRLDGSLFYGAIEHVRDALRDLDSTGARAGTSGAHHVLVIAESINRIDLAGAQMLKVEADRLAGTGGALHLAGLKQPVMAMLAATGALDAIGAHRLHPTKAAAIAAIYAGLDPAVCGDCQVRLFNECQVRLPDGTLRKPPAAAMPADAPL